MKAICSIGQLLQRGKVTHVGRSLHVFAEVAPYQLGRSIILVGVIGRRVAYNKIVFSEARSPCDHLTLYGRNLSQLLAPTCRIRPGLISKECFSEVRLRSNRMPPIRYQCHRIRKVSILTSWMLSVDAS